MRRGWMILGFSLLVFASALFVIEPAMAQFPRVSPGASVSQTIGLTDVTLTYSRPGVKGRKIWGGLVPYNEVWRTGANEATTISFSEEATINGQKLAAGKYSLFTIPTETSWTIIFNKQADIWGTDYNKDNDILRIQVQPREGPHVEWMMFTFRNLTSNAAEVVLNWAKLQVPFTIQFDVHSTVLKNARSAMASAKPDDWRTPFAAANYCAQNSINHQEALQWIDKSIEAQQNYANLSVKAKLLAEMGNTSEAINYGEKALAAAAASERKPNTSEIESLLAKWRTANK